MAQAKSMKKAARKFKATTNSQHNQLAEPGTTGFLTRQTGLTVAGDKSAGCTHGFHTGYASGMPEITALSFPSKASIFCWMRIYRCLTGKRFTSNKGSL
ncbi:hypothetical protein GCM10022405_12010 [Gibbsiella dentisursi]|uniref:Uncharacterized protein n=1 Tax=Gibbsiella dentisursi TaxID=796890 RepID=A0ABP7KX41_9GAMM